MGIISCRSREASLIPNDIRVEATTNVTALISESGDARRASPDREKACRRHCCESKWKGNEGHLLYHRTRQHEEVGNG